MPIEGLRVGRRKRPPLITIYGPPGIGKTTFAAGAPNPVFITTEDGVDALDVASFAPAKSLDEFYENMKKVYESKEFSTLVVDSLDFLDVLIMQHICVEHDVEQIRQIPYGAGYPLISQKWVEFMDRCDAMVDSGMAVVLIAHADLRRVDPPDGDSYQQRSLKINKRGETIVYARSRGVFYADEKTNIVSKGDENSSRNIAIGTGVRIMRTGISPGTRAKNMWGLPDVLPLSWDAFYQAYNQSYERD